MGGCCPGNQPSPHTKECLEVKTGGTWDLGVLAREGPLSPRVAKEAPPPGSPACSELMSLRPGGAGGGQVTPWGWAKGRTFPAGQALWWQLRALPVLCAWLQLVLVALVGEGGGGRGSAWVGYVILGVEARERERHPQGGRK